MDSCSVWWNGGLENRVDQATDGVTLGDLLKACFGSGSSPANVDCIWSCFMKTRSCRFLMLLTSFSTLEIALFIYFIYVCIKRMRDLWCRACLSFPCLLACLISSVYLLVLVLPWFVAVCYLLVLFISLSCCVVVNYYLFGSKIVASSD